MRVTYYSALWSPVSTTSTSDLFLTYGDYIYYGLLKTSFLISISETTYYVMNVQQPIAKKAEIIFHNLLFTIVCLELFGLIFIAMKLICLPLFNSVRHLIEKHTNLIHPEHFLIHLTSHLSRHPSHLISHLSYKSSHPTLWNRRSATFKSIHEIWHDSSNTKTGFFIR